MSGAEDGSLAAGQGGIQVLAPADLDQPPQGRARSRSRITSIASQEANRNQSLVSRSAASGLISSPSSCRRLRVSSARFRCRDQKSQSPRQHAMR